jgi:hypothetical protein
VSCGGRGEHRWRNFFPALFHVVRRRSALCGNSASKDCRRVYGAEFRLETTTIVAEALDLYDLSRCIGTLFTGLSFSKVHFNYLSDSA